MGKSVKTKSCKCGKLTVEFHGNTVYIKGGWLKGSPHTHARCFECRGSVRIAFDIVFKDKRNKPFHPKSARKSSGSKSRNRTRKGHSRKPEKQGWRFMDKDTW